MFIDLEKAYDTVNYDILLSKLEHCDIRKTPLLWFQSYLSQRYQYISITGNDSNLMKITCCVPQGSVLGPLLFLLFISDLPNVSKKLSFYLFADDISIYYESESPEKLSKKVNTKLRYVKNWLDSNKLSLNIDKTNYIIFHSPGTKLPLGSTIKIGNKHAKFLGLLLDEQLDWNYHLWQLLRNNLENVESFLRSESILPLIQ